MDTPAAVREEGCSVCWGWWETTSSAGGRTCTRGSGLIAPSSSRSGVIRGLGEMLGEWPAGLRLAPLSAPGTGDGACCTEGEEAASTDGSRLMAAATGWCTMLVFASCPSDAGARPRGSGG